jgi:hypothetical protein
VKRVSLFGYLIIVSFIITGVFYKEYLTSVWCFFAALVSSVIYLVVRESNEEIHLSDMKLLKLLNGRTKNFRNQP